MRRATALVLPLALIPALLLTVCRKGPEGSKAEAASTVPFEPLPATFADSFSGEKAFQHVADIVALGPRPPESKGHADTLDYIEKSLAASGWTSRRQTLRAATPDGPMTFTNLIARYSSAPAMPDSLPVILGGHFDSKILPFPFVGANDGGSSTGIMIEIARVLSADPKQAAKVELVFFDGEEAIRENITPSDGLYGSKYFAHEMLTRRTLPAFGMVIDIVGDPRYALYWNPESPATFQEAVARESAALAFALPVKVAPGQIIDDHIPLQNAGLPCLHLIGDFMTMPYWHQPGDTLDKVTPEMLDRVGKLVLRFLSTPGLVENPPPP
ncbi:MAG: M28 family peptidase [Akkermansiaceae bacterium]|jgi:hypothetical protein|nr:M28 family peptidase [Akkermansiaceae bacterium]